MKLKWKFPNQLFEGKLLGLYKNQKLEIAVMHKKNLLMIKTRFIR